MSLTDYSQGCRLFSFMYISRVFGLFLFLNPYKKQKASTIFRLSMLFSSRGDWIRTSDHTPPRRVL